MYDVRIALRGLRRAPAFAITAILILGLGIGVATAMLTVFRAVLVGRVPVTDPDRLVVLRSLNRGATKVDPAGRVVTEMARAGRTVRGVAGIYHFANVPLPRRDGNRQVVMTACAVTGNFFDVLGVRPLLGRCGDPAIIGRKLFEPGIE